MFKCVVAEYKYYQSIKVYEPEIWMAIAKPTVFMIPFLFISNKKQKLLRTATNEKVHQCAKRFRKSAIIFICYLVVVLVGAIIYFKIHR
ncbi:hypothetical protein J8L70_03425 [Pseudoalteromonas sp. MMG010]|uniref:hypothetical protein n=1 Tax=Pseudoalteromonas sp. MMG010 TaxID=2822685 RepID=UPI001B39DCEC|nr:hypothetical protein [Pseudoalteromonas sp. MMG010]MBQ4832283.1 hypothetical protein [Pseudoalteromonas sp. MMG010]